MTNLARAAAITLFSATLSVLATLGGPARAAPDAERIDAILATAGMSAFAVEATPPNDVLAIAPDAVLAWRAEGVIGSLTTVPIADSAAFKDAASSAVDQIDARCIGWFRRFLSPIKDSPLGGVRRGSTTCAVNDDDMIWQSLILAQTEGKLHVFSHAGEKANKKRLKELDEAFFQALLAEGLD